MQNTVYHGRAVNSSHISKSPLGERAAGIDKTDSVCRIKNTPEGGIEGALLYTGGLPTVMTPRQIQSGGGGRMGNGRGIKVLRFVVSMMISILVMLPIAPKAC